MKSRVLCMMVFVLSMATYAYGAGDLFVMGSFGIGTTTPSQALHVQGQANDPHGGTALLFKAYPGYDAAIFIDVEQMGKTPNLRFQYGGTTNWVISNYTTDNSLRMATTKNGTMFVMTNTGNVGIGQIPTGGYKLYVNGTSYSTGGWQSSDIRFKENTVPIESALDKVKGIDGVSYNWRTEEFKDMGFPEGRHYGVIGQQIEKILPEVVSTSPSGEKAVAYTEIIPVLIEAIKEQQKKIEQLEADIALLGAKN